ncbi:LuxR family transcriptional regulator [Pseudomonas fluorescens]|uniref:LuxR family transcriptional regulator n=1 Tax=Pseudomonas fluorescens TaxID=294 RepID=A0A944HF32_PSEFL|nr:LuxR family transcriptional regulator [Pseudomonas fluorescens]MBT2297953.1 LuxR family transcriptional regulator [Pseudomonas fluorescens]MBT2310223.1 LuxR family transcriptional regulator [Pseudomonas fluorescens]MBT2315341.1 LuxR family transcriptional regulator [Pseudomonas fluorescens]MBT2320443.1 LuxR family transcriptional regulator [Pseudomonas fluorescens]MBT2332036.1 LuxR family transcriptional regulator [Pseudomonas fluorescens]
MQVKLSDFNTRLLSGRNLDEQMDHTLLMVQALGFEALVYDYSPVPLDHEGALITPSVLKLRNTPHDWHSLWCKEGYYQIDPVQHLAVNAVSPFVWSYRAEADTVLQSFIGQSHAPVVSYLQDSRMTCGVTVPIHLPKGGFATLTGLRSDISGSTLEQVRQTLGDFSLISHALQEAAFPLLSKEAHVCPVRLTKRERECLRWAAEGLTTADIARQLNRSLATITLHLTSAMHKLGAKNRVQAVVRAVHYRLLDS